MPSAILFDLHETLVTAWNPGRRRSERGDRLALRESGYSVTVVSNTTHEEVRA